MHKCRHLASLIRLPRLREGAFKGSSHKAVLENKKSLRACDSLEGGRHFQEGLLDPLHLHVRCQRVEKQRPIVAILPHFEHRSSHGAPTIPNVMNRHRQDGLELASLDEQVELHGILGLVDVLGENGHIHALLG